MRLLSAANHATDEQHALLASLGIGTLDGAAAVRAVADQHAGEAELDPDPGPGPALTNPDPSRALAPTPTLSLALSSGSPPFARRLLGWARTRTRPRGRVCHGRGDEGGSRRRRRPERACGPRLAQCGAVRAVHRRHAPRRMRIVLPIAARRPVPGVLGTVETRGARGAGAATSAHIGDLSRSGRRPEQPPCSSYAAGELPATCGHGPTGQQGSMYVCMYDPTGGHDSNTQV